MNTIIIEHADEKLTALLKQLAEIAGVPMKTKREDPGTAAINPKIKQAISDYESGQSEGKQFTANELMSEFERMIADNA